MKFKHLLLFGIISWISVLHTFAQNSKYTISGYITDEQNGESLIGASVFVELKDGRKVGATANVYGFYSLELPEGKYKINYAYVGFGTIVKEINLESSTKINISLTEGQQLAEIVVTSERKNENVQSTDMGRVELGIEEIGRASCRERV